MSVKLRNAVRTAVSSSTIASVGALAIAGAVVPGTALGQDEAIEEVTVVGIRSSLRQSLDLKRQSGSIIDAVTSEDVGKFPDRNVAESLQRIPGVTIQRQFGEGAAVSIRGAGNELTLTTLNGQNVASTGWFVLEPAKRSFNYELLPSELVGEIKVYKSSQADLNEGGVGGTVEIVTRKPLELDAMTFHATAEYSQQNDSDTSDPQFSGMFSWKNDGNSMGVLLSAVSHSRTLQRQGNEAFWEWGAGPVGFKQDRNRSALTATFQFAPSDALDITINAMEMEMEADNTNYALWLTQGNTSWSGVPVPPEDLLNGTPVRGPLNVAFYQMRPREATMDSNVYDLTLAYHGDGFRTDFTIGETTSSGGTDFEMVLDDGLAPAIPGGTYDFTNGAQTWDTAGFDISTYDPGVLVMGTGPAFNATPKTDEEAYAQLDFTFDVELGPVRSVKTGIRYSDHNTTSRRFEFDQVAGFDPAIPTSELGGDSTIDVGSGNYQIVEFDPNKAKAIAKASITGRTEDLGAYSEIDEENISAYIMAEFETDVIRGNMGLRYASTDATSTYYTSGELENTSADYSEILPSLNLVYYLDDDVLLRTSAARVMARPQYVDMYVNPNVVGTNDDLPDNQFWIVGNVGLKPFIANQFDMGIEWYFAEGSMVSATYFMKDVKNFVTIREYRADSDDIPFTLVNNPPGQANEYDNGWTVQEKQNGKSADIQGFELQYQQDFGNGFGALVNYTYTDTDVDSDTFTDGNPVLSDSSKNSYNVTGYFENELLQLRLAYNERDEYLLRESGAYGNRLHDSYGSLDFSGEYFINDNFSVTLDVNNILEDESRQFGNNSQPTPNSGFTPGFPLYEYETARRITVGVSAKF